MVSWTEDQLRVVVGISFVMIQVSLLGAFGWPSVMVFNGVYLFLRAGILRKEQVKDGWE